jgi:hypothetical protein
VTILAGAALVAGALLSATVWEDRHACSDADGLLEAGLVDEADKEYKAVLTDDPGRQCAQRGANAAAQAFCDVADDQRRRGRPVEAAEQVSALLKRHPRALCALALLETISPAACDAASRAPEAQAAKAYEALLAAGVVCRT